MSVEAACITQYTLFSCLRTVGTHAESSENPLKLTLPPKFLAMDAKEKHAQQPFLPASHFKGLLGVRKVMSRSEPYIVDDLGVKFV